MFAFFGVMIGCGDKAPENQLPSATIINPEAELSLLAGVEIEFQAELGDAETASEQLQITWLLDDEHVCSGSESNAAGFVSCSLTPNIGSHVMMIEVFDQDGGSSGSTIAFEIVDGEAPQASITAPNAEVLYADISISLEATVQDDEDSMEALSVLWRSDIDDIIVESVTANVNGEIQSDVLLSAGVHQLSIEVTDLRGKVGTDVRSIEVRPANSPPTCSWGVPEDDTSAGSGEMVDLQINVDDVDFSADNLLVTWTSDIDGELGTSTPTSLGLAEFHTNELTPGDHALQAIVTDDFGLTCTDGVFFQVGTAPVLSWLSPNDGDISLEGDATELSILVEDEDQLASEIALQWSSNLDGIIGTMGTDSSGQASLVSTSLSRGTHIIEVVAVDQDGLSTVASISIIVNGAPSVPTIDVTPIEIYSDHDITVSASGSVDPEGQSVTYSYEWFNNGQLSTASNSTVLPSSATLKGELWTVEVTPNDGQHDGVSVTESITVLNSAPSLVQVLLSPTSPDKNDVVQCTPSGAIDIDGDPVTFAYSWYVNGNLQPVSISELEPQYFLRGDSLYCAVTPFDGSDIGIEIVSSTETIVNALPVVGNVDFSPAAPASDDDINCLYDFEDADSDGDDSLIEWFVNGVQSGTGNPLGTMLAQGDILECQVTGNDALQNGNTASNSVTISNSPPVLESVSISPSSPVYGDILTCDLGLTTDYDGDSNFGYTYEWLVNGTVVSTLDTLSSYFLGGDSVECSVVPSDSTASGSIVSDAVSIAHTAPVVSNVSITPANPIADADLYCNYTFSDVDSGADQSIISWTVNSVAAGQGNPLNGSISRGDSIACSVEAADVNGLGNTLSASTSIINDIPEITLLSLSPAAIQTNDIVFASVVTSDADNDGISHQYSWYVNGNVVTNASQLDGNGFFDRGDSIYLELEPSDGFSSGAVYTSPVVVVENALPTSPELYINHLDQTRVIDDLVCATHTTSEDPDGDTVGYTYSWTVDGVSFSGGSSTYVSNDTILAQDTLRGEVWECSVEVTDGNGGMVTVTDSVTVSPDLTQRIGTGYSHSCFLDAQGTIECWGPSISPVTQIPTGVFTELVSAGDSNCALREDGNILCWGDNSFGQSNAPSGDFIQVSLSSYHGCAVDTSREVQCWGRNDYGETDSPAGPFVRVGAMHHITCGIRDDASMECWGSNDVGVLTDPPVGSYLTPGFGSNAFDSYACAVSDLGINCWGTDNYSMVLNAVNGDYERIALGRNHICALAFNGEIDCWGANFQGQTGSCAAGLQGVCTTSNSNYISVSAGGNHTCAITDANTVECWGLDSNGQVSGWSGN